MRIHLDGDLRFAEKNPRNSTIVRFLLDTFPDSQFIHIIRDGRDAALSLSKRPWLQAAQASSGKREPGGYLFGPHAHFWVEKERADEFENTSDIHRCIWNWRRFVECVLKAAKDFNDGQYHEVKYENLITNPSGEADSILNFLGIEKKSSRNIFQRAVARANPNSIGRWRNELDDDALCQIEKEAGELLRCLDYC